MSAPRLETLRQRVQACTTDQDVADYQRDGAVCIRNLFTPEEVALLRDGIEANLAQPSPRGMVASRPDDPGRFFEDFCNWQDIPQYKRFIFDSPLKSATFTMTGPFRGSWKQKMLYFDQKTVRMECFDDNERNEISTKLLAYFTSFPRLGLAFFYSGKTRSKTTFYRLNSVVENISPLLLLPPSNGEGLVYKKLAKMHIITPSFPCMNSS